MSADTAASLRNHLIPEMRMFGELTGYDAVWAGQF
jgi:hypothetical protein